VIGRMGRSVAESGHALGIRKRQLLVNVLVRLGRNWHVKARQFWRFPVPVREPIRPPERIPAGIGSLFSSARTFSKCGDCARLRAGRGGLVEALRLSEALAPREWAALRVLAAAVSLRDKRLNGSSPGAWMAAHDELWRATDLFIQALEEPCPA